MYWNLWFCTSDSPTCLWRCSVFRQSHMHSNLSSYFLRYSWVPYYIYSLIHCRPLFDIRLCSNYHIYKNSFQHTEHKLVGFSCQYWCRPGFLSKSLGLACGLVSDANFNVLVFILTLLKNQLFWSCLNFGKNVLILVLKFLKNWLSWSRF